MDQSISSISEATRRDSTLLSGILSGQVAGLIMAVVMMAVFTLFLHKGPLYPVQVIGSTLVGETALHGFNLKALLAGLLLHQLGPSLLWGIVFGFLAKRFYVDTALHAMTLGIGLGLFAMVGPYLLIPPIMRAMQGVDIWAREVPALWDWAAHIVFGASFAFFPAIHRKLAR